MSKKGNIWSYPTHFRQSLVIEEDDFSSPSVHQLPEANNINLSAESDRVPMVDNNINLSAESDQVPMVDNNINLSAKSDQVPIVDIQRLDDEILKEACRKWGLFRVVNHGIPSQLMEELMATAKKLFDLPFEIKQKLICDGNSISNSLVYFWGTPALTPSGAELPRDSSRVDWVEGFNAPFNQLLRYSDSATVANSINNLPTSSIISDFSKLLKDYGEHTTRVAKTLFEAMAKNLNNIDIQLEGNSLWYHNYLDEATGSFRVYRYPPKTTCTSTGLNDHTDSSLISILNQDEVGGLEYFKDDDGGGDDNSGGLWVGVKPVPNTLVVNLGDMMQAISGDEYKSVRHRVRLNSRTERLSICYFVFPGDNTCITSLKGNYKPFTYNQFRSMVQSDIATYGWKMLGLQHFKN